MLPAGRSSGSAYIRRSSKRGVRLVDFGDGSTVAIADNIVEDDETIVDALRCHESSLSDAGREMLTTREDVSDDAIEHIPEAADSKIPHRRGFVRCGIG